MNERNPIKTIETVRNSLAFILVLAFVGMIAMLLYKRVPEGNNDIVVYMVGQLSGMALTVLGFYFVNKVGQDALDAARTDNTSKALDAIKATAEVAQAPSGDQAAQAADKVADAAVDKADEIKGHV